MKEELTPLRPVDDADDDPRTDYWPLWVACKVTLGLPVYSPDVISHKQDLRTGLVGAGLSPDAIEARVQEWCAHMECLLLATQEEHPAHRLCLRAIEAIDSGELSAKKPLHERRLRGKCWVKPWDESSSVPWYEYEDIERQAHADGVQKILGSINLVVLRSEFVSWAASIGVAVPVDLRTEVMTGTGESAGGLLPLTGTIPLTRLIPLLRDRDRQDRVMQRAMERVMERSLEDPIRRAANQIYGPQKQADPEPQTDSHKPPAKSWAGLDAVCTLEGIKLRQGGASGRWAMWTWADLGLASKKAERRRALLMELAKRKGDLSEKPRNEEAYTKLVSVMNKMLREKVGIPENLLIMRDGHTLTIFKSFIWDDGECVPKPEMVPLRPEEVDKTKARWSLGYDGPEDIE